MNGHDPDPRDVPAAEVDRRFEELMRAEFGRAEPVRRFEATPVDGLAAGSPAEPVFPAPFSFDALWDDVTPDEEADDAEYRRVEAGTARWSAPMLVGAALLVGGLVACLVMLFGVNPGQPWPQVAAGAAVVGLAVLLWRALRLERDEDEDLLV